MLIYLKVKPNQRFDKVEKAKKEPGTGGAEWQIRLKAPAVDGKANEHLVDYLSKILGLPKSRITLKKGQTARIKCLEITGDEQAILTALENQANRVTGKAG